MEHCFLFSFSFNVHKVCMSCVVKRNNYISNVTKHCMKKNIFWLIFTFIFYTSTNKGWSFPRKLDWALVVDYAPLPLPSFNFLVGVAVPLIQSSYLKWNILITLSRPPCPTIDSCCTDFLLSYFCVFNFIFINQLKNLVNRGHG